MKLTDFRLATEEEIKVAKKSWRDTLIGEAIFPYSPEGYHRTVIYKVLDETFGSPNYYPGDNSLWIWVFKTNTGLLTVYDYKGSWSIGFIYSEHTEELEQEAELLKTALLKEAQKVKFSKKQIKDNKVGGSLKNPYILYKNTAWNLLLQASKFEEEIKQLQHQNSDFIEKLNKLSGLSLINSSLYRSAFMNFFCSLEGFINLVYALFLKARYRSEFYSNKLRNEYLPHKILEMDTYCHSFKVAPFTTKDELFKAIQYFIDIRNKFIHANIGEEMEEHLVKVGKYYVVTGEKAKGKYGLPTDFDNIDKIHTLRASKLVTKFVVKTLQSFNDDIKFDFAIVHPYIWINYFWEGVDKIKIVLGPEDYVGKEEIEEFLESSTELDKEYYDIDMEVPEEMPIH